jgi:hypothetical protein
METLITTAMRAATGLWGDPVVAPPICASDIRRWAIATHWPERPPRLYWDDGYAATTRWGGIVAPADFNPFAWPIERTERPNTFDTGPDGVRLAPMNGGQADTYGVPMRAGDVVTAQSRVTDLTEKKTRLGLTLFFTTEFEWSNQHELLVRRRLSQGVRYVVAA